jgi:hypothetical protein
LRLVHITELPPKPSQFTILVRGIPWSAEESYCEAVKKFFTYYHASTYLSHQIVYESCTVQKLKVCILSLTTFMYIKTTFHLCFLYSKLIVQFSKPCLFFSHLVLSKVCSRNLKEIIWFKLFWLYLWGLLWNIYIYLLENYWLTFICILLKKFLNTYDVP